MKLLFTILVLFLCTSVVSAQNSSLHNVKPSTGYVPNQETAIRIAIAIWEPIYGREQIEKQRPFHAQLIDEVWHVEGSIKADSLGGVAMAEISKKDGKILLVSHGK